MQIQAVMNCLIVSCVLVGIVASVDLRPWSLVQLANIVITTMITRLKKWSLNTAHKTHTPTEQLTPTSACASLVLPVTAARKRASQIIHSLVSNAPPVITVRVASLK